MLLEAVLPQLEMRCSRKEPNPYEGLAWVQEGEGATLLKRVENEGMDFAAHNVSMSSLQIFCVPQLVGERPLCAQVLSLPLVAAVPFTDARQGEGCQLVSCLPPCCGRRYCNPHQEPPSQTTVVWDAAVMMNHQHVAAAVVAMQHTSG
jgi:hypothetical protein